MSTSEPVAVTEFGEFFESHSGDGSVLVFLTEHEVLRTGECRMTCGFSDGAAFQLLVPASYPHGRHLEFTVKTMGGSSKVDEWGVHMKQFAAANRGRIRLNALLLEGITYYTLLTSCAPTRADAASPMGSRSSSGIASPKARDGEDSPMEDDGDWSEDEAEVDDDCFTTDFEIRVDILRKAWRKKELELRAADDAKEASQSGAASTSSFKRKEGENIFDHESAASQVLTSEIVDFMRDGEAEGLVVQPIDDNIYSWNVRLSKFASDSRLAAQMRDLRAHYDYAYVEMQLDFNPAYPFYPPSLRVVRPRFEGTLVQALANVDMLKLTYWNPATSMRTLLAQIKRIMEAKASIRATAERNDARVYPEGAYIEIEAELIRLAQVTEVRPRGSYDVIDVDNLALAPTIRRITEDAHAQLMTSAKGGASADVVFVQPPTKVHKASTSSAKPLASTMAILSTTSKYAMLTAGGGGWAKGTGYGTGHQRTEWNHEQYRKAQDEKDRQMLLVIKSVLSQLESDGVRECSDLYEIIESSALIPFIERELAEDSFVELVRHYARFMLVLDVVSMLANHCLLAPLLVNLPRQRTPVVLLLQRLATSARQFLAQMDKSDVARAAHADDPNAVDDEHDDEMDFLTKSILLTHHGQGKLPKSISLMGGAGSSKASSSKIKPKAGTGTSKGKSAKELTLRSKMKSFLSKTAGAPSTSSSQPSASEILSLVHAQKTIMSQLSESTSTLLSTLESKFALEDGAHPLTSAEPDVDDDDHVAILETVKLKGKQTTMASATAALESYQAAMTAAVAKSKAWQTSSKYYPSTSGGQPSAPSQAIKAYLAKSKFEKRAKEVSESTQTVELDANGVEVDRDRVLAERLVEVFEIVQTVLAEADLGYTEENDDEDETMSTADSSTSMKTSDELETTYVKEMKPMQLVSGVDTIVVDAHQYGKSSSSSYPARAIKAIFREQTALRSSLPLTLSSSIFVVTDENKMHLLSAMITGPPDTPYANGCFVFDVQFPPGYPNKPPHVNFRTNGGGSVRFNPNLYNCGKVCLSLLGTWAGDSGEQWNAHTSTLLQVLVSIQSLILVDEPYYNEPGYERSRVSGVNAASEAYTKNIRGHTVKWAILEQIRHPPRLFADVVRRHFTLKAQIVLDECTAWAKADSANGKHLGDIQKELEKLVGRKLTVTGASSSPSEPPTVKRTPSLRPSLMRKAKAAKTTAKSTSKTKKKPMPDDDEPEKDLMKRMFDPDDQGY